MVEKGDGGAADEATDAGFWLWGFEGCGWRGGGGVGGGGRLALVLVLSLDKGVLRGGAEVHGAAEEVGYIVSEAEGERA